MMWNGCATHDRNSTSDCLAPIILCVLQQYVGHNCAGIKGEQVSNVGKVSKLIIFFANGVLICAHRGPICIFRIALATFSH